MQISDVSLISTEEFLAMQQPAPKAPAKAPDHPAEPVPQDQVAILQPPAPEPTPKPAPLPAPDQPAPDSAPTPDPGTLIAPTPPEPQPEVAQPVLPVPETPPPPSPRIASENTPKPETDAEVAKVPEKATVESKDATKPAEAKVEKAPKQSSTEIVTEAEKPKETLAPQKSVRPKTRPAELVARKEEPKPEKPQRSEPLPPPKPTPKPAPSPEDLIAAQIAADLKAQQASQTPGPGGTGVALTDQERHGLVLAIQDCWSVPVGIQNAEDLVVTLSVDLAPNGGLASSPKLIEPKVADGQYKQAFEAARRALIACAPYELPPEKYDTWKRLEVVFNPKDMVLR